MIFRDRKHAGQKLGEKLIKFKGMDPLVLALPRGGVLVAAEIASALDATMDVLAVRKIGAPFQPELAVGALCEDDSPIWIESILSRAGLQPQDLAPSVQVESKNIKKQIQLFRQGRELKNLKNKFVILVDDGLATGATMAAAVKYLKKKGAAKIIVAVPISALSSAQRLRSNVDEVIAVDEKVDLGSVGQWYEDFAQVENEEVISILAQRKRPTSSNNITRDIKIPVDRIHLNADLTELKSMQGLIIFAHGSGSSRKSPRNQEVARFLNENGFGTLLLDLLTDQEAKDRRNVFDMDLLSYRLAMTAKWLRTKKEFSGLPFAFFGASTGAGAALMAAAQLSGQDQVAAIVSRGGRPDLAGKALKSVNVPTLLLVGGNDYGVIELNQKAQSLLSYCELSIVPGATHLFEEPGALEEVSRQAAQWFQKHLSLAKPKSKNNHKSDLGEVIYSSMKAIRKESDLDHLIESVKGARIVMLGESTHGTEDFYQLRRLISQRLIKEQGFKFIAVEGDWPDAYRLHKYIQNPRGSSARNVLMQNHRWPTWMWANEEIVRLAEWMKNHKAGFYGLDVYSLFESIAEVISYVSRHHPELTDEIKKRYSCLEAYKRNEISYARSLIKYPAGCEKEVLKNLESLLKLRVKTITQNQEELFSSQQNARVVANAESYYRAMLSGDASSWNVRDRHMLETLGQLLEKYGEGAKGIVWAHNTHIGDYRATDMLESGYVNLGGLAREKYGDENVALVGFGSYQGEVLAGSAWGAPEQVMQMPRAQEQSYEHCFHQAAEKAKTNQLYLVFDEKSDAALAKTLGHRAIGVVYDPQHERRGNYVPTQLSQRYDAFVFVDKSSALKSLHAMSVRGEFPETWPSGQ